MAIHSAVKTVFVGIATITAGLFAASAAVGADLPATKRSVAGLYVTAIEAAKKLKDPKVVFVDLRTRAEIMFLGLPSRVNVHIPYLVMPSSPQYDAKSFTYSLVPNPNFAADFEGYVMDHDLSEDTVFVLMCRSGNRSAKAASLLHSMGYTHVYSITDGFEGDRADTGPDAGKRVVNGWRNKGFEWSYKIRPAQIYPRDGS